MKCGNEGPPSSGGRPVSRCSLPGRLLSRWRAGGFRTSRAALLGEWAPGSSDITFGSGGQPLFINGPRDNVHQVMARLLESVGNGNSHYVIQAPRTAQ